MSTQVTVAVAKPNHLAVDVHAENRVGAQWQPEKTVRVPYGGAETFLVHATRRLIIEEIPSA